jgi:hypothetical protein
MLTLHTYRFLGDYATLSVHECAGRGRVLVRMEGDISKGEEFAVFLTTDQWTRLCAFDPFDERGQPLQDVTRALTFKESQESDLLEVNQVAERDVVHLSMRKEVPAHDADFVLIALDPAEWDRLVSLDLLSSTEMGAPAAAPPDRRPAHTIH